jgi:hypothetical protein
MKRAIPSPNANQQDINRAVKENLEQIMGQRLPEIRKLPPQATNDEIIARINAIIERLQQ